LAIGTVSSFAQRDARQIVPNENLSLKKEIERSISRGVKFLLSKQDENGMWGEKEFPALTALPTTALLLDPNREEGEPVSKEARAGLEHLVKSVRLDGGIYGKGLGSYNTSLSMMAMLASEDAKYQSIILRARKFLVNQQSDYDKKGDPDNVFDGGVGYGSSYSHPDLSNTYFALEALAATKSMIAEQPDEIDLDWEAAINFIQNCQHNPETNQEDWVSKDPKDKGGFVYFPGKSMSEEEIANSGKVLLRSYGSMSYAGLLSFIYADLKPDDPRVAACLNWLEKNFTVEENPGMGQQGLYYYFHTMAKGLSVAGIDQITTKDGKKIDWRVMLTKKFLNEQEQDGSWINENGRWWEKDPVLVTSYAILSLARIYEGL
ncbi:MAG: squalene-hopene/tetraprenyl-beta-curcumene cyclase, partial [Verrucomicrobiales bacterium]